MACSGRNGKRYFFEVDFKCVLFCVFCVCFLCSIVFFSIFSRGVLAFLVALITWLWSGVECLQRVLLKRF